MKKNNMFGITMSNQAKLKEGYNHPTKYGPSETEAQIIENAFKTDLTGSNEEAGHDIRTSIDKINKDFETGSNGRTGIAKIMFEKEADVSKWPTIGDYTYIESFIRMLTETNNDIDDKDLNNIMKYFYRRR